MRFPGQCRLSCQKCRNLILYNCIHYAIRKGIESMIIKPKVRGFICTTAHPIGCAKHVQDQIDYVKQQPAIDGPKKVLVVGSSTGYGLASRIAAAFGSRAATLGVCFER